MPTQVADLLARPLVKYGLPVLLLIAAAVGFRLWLSAHDRAVRAEYLVELKEQARKDSEKAAAKADKQFEDRKEQDDETLDRIGNSSSVDELFRRLREGR